MGVFERGPALSQIETRWSLVLQAHQANGDATVAAQRILMERYSGAVHRYLLLVAHDAEIAADLAQEFALRFLRGDFHRADPSRGRFRDYVKTSVLNLVSDARRRQKISPKPLPDDETALASPGDDMSELDRQFLDCWRDELLSRAWDRLNQHEQVTKQPYYTVLRHRATHPAERSHEIAANLSPTLGKPLTAVWVRQILKRARGKFIDLLQEEVDRSLENPTEERRIDEMQALGLWEYCREKRPTKDKLA